MQQSPVILDLCLRKTRVGKSQDYRDVIVFKQQQQQQQQQQQSLFRAQK